MLIKEAESSLSHFGVKGMQWGKRKADDSGGGDSGGSATPNGPTKQTKSERKEWKKSASSADTATEAFSRAAKDFKKSYEIINNDPNYKGKDLTKDKALARDYDKTMSAAFNQHLAERSIELTLNKEGRAYIYEYNSQTGMMRGSEYKLEQASTKPFPDFKADQNELGQVVGLEPIFDISHTEMFLDDFFAHYGVKGMQWGKRKNDGVVTPVSIKETPGKRVSAVGGRNQPASDDAKAAASARQTAKQSTVDALTNKELQGLVTRLNLEQQYTRLTAPKQSKGKAFIQTLIKNPEKRKQAKRALVSNPVTQEYLNAKAVGDLITNVRLD